MDCTTPVSDSSEVNSNNNSTYDIDDTRYPFTVPDHWAAKCRASYNWCRAFWRRLMVSGHFEDLFASEDFKKKEPKRLPPEERATILRECEGKGHAACARMLHEARQRQEVAWMIGEALRLKEERDNKAASQRLVIGLTSLVMLLVISSLILYCFIFKGGSGGKGQKKSTKKKVGPSSRISSYKGKSSLKRSKFSAKSGGTGGHHHGHHHHGHHKKSSKSAASSSTAKKSSSTAKSKKSGLAARAAKSTSAKSHSKPHTGKLNGNGKRGGFGKK